MEFNRKGFFDYYLVMSHMTTLFGHLDSLIASSTMSQIWELSNSHFSTPKNKTKQKLIKFTQLNASSSNPFSASYVNEMNRMKLLNFIQVQHNIYKWCTSLDHIWLQQLAKTMGQ
jgi:hypothetical protein